MKIDFALIDSLIKDKTDSLGSKILYSAISGSHIWGLDRPESDIDVRGIYMDDSLKFLGLRSPKTRDTIEATLPFNDTYIDLQLYEIGKFLSMLCNHNGNMVMLLSNPMVFRISLDIPWVALAREFTTKKLSRYYRGYAESQRKRSLSERGGKALVYTYREMFEGLYVMRYGTTEFDFMKLWETARLNGWYSYSYGMLDKYWENPSMEVSDEGWRWFYREWEDLCIKLDDECQASSLPDTFDGHNWCNQLLTNLRLKYLPYNLGDNVREEGC